MPYINLIQEQRARAQAEEARARFGFMAFVVVTSLSILVYGYLMIKSDGLASEKNDLQAQLQRLEPTVKQIEANKKIELELQPRLGTLEEASKLTGKWITVLEDISVQTPPDTWITNMRGVAGDPNVPITLTVSGMSDRQELIGEFTSRMQNNPALDNVTFHFSNEKPVGPGRALEFELGADIKDTASAPPIVEAKP
jgi:Tfp pilus assembly protein PilN